MICKSKLEKLDEDELCILLYVLNEHKSGDNEINVPELYNLRPHFVFEALNKSVEKIKPEHTQKLQIIADKLVNS